MEEVLEADGAGDMKSRNKRSLALLSADVHCRRNLEGQGEALKMAQPSGPLLESQHTI